MDSDSAQASHPAPKSSQSAAPPRKQNTMMLPRLPPPSDRSPYSTSQPSTSTSISSTTGRAPSSEKQRYIPPHRTALLSSNPSTFSRLVSLIPRPTFSGPYLQKHVPLNRKLGVWFQSRFLADAKEGLEIRMARKFGRSEWSIEDVKTGGSVMGCSAHPHSKDRLRIFEDESGKKVFQLRKKNLSSNVRIAETQDGGAVLFSIKHDILHVTPRWTINFTNTADGIPIKLEVKADYARRNVDVLYDGLQIGHINRPDGPVRELFSRAHVYAVHVAPGVDYSIMVALCVVFDDMRTEEGYP